jgi:hypothetical protein
VQQRSRPRVPGPRLFGEEKEDLLSGFKRRSQGVSMPVSCLYLRSTARRICASESRNRSGKPWCHSKRDPDYIFC